MRIIFKKISPPNACWRVILAAYEEELNRNSLNHLTWHIVLEVDMLPAHAPLSGDYAIARNRNRWPSLEK